MESITRVGIDASKDVLEVLIDRPAHRRHTIGNNKEGFAQLVKELGAGNYLIAIEATGRYESGVRHALELAGYKVTLKNPRRVRRLAEGLGIAAKTDRIDAQVLADTAELGKPTYARSKEREMLGDISRMIEVLKQERAAHMKRLKVPGLSEVSVRSLKQVIACLKKQIQRLEKDFVAAIKKSSQIHQYKLALTVPCVGPVLARVVICELPENLGDFSIRKISAYAGVAPIDDTSGKTKHPPRISRHMNAHLKAALYMPALTALQNFEWAKNIYARLLAKGLEHQQAMIAIMHKLLFHLIAVLKRGSAWKADPPKRA